MIYAMFALVLLTTVVSIRLLVMRFGAVKSGKISVGYFRLFKGADVPTQMEQAARNYSNLFELPILFYAAGAIAIGLHLETITLIIISWLFVLSRVLHSWIHLTSNNVLHRLKAFLFGAVLVFTMWLILVWEYTLNLH